MAWNNSKGGVENSKPKKSVRKAPSVLRGMLAAAIIVAVGVGVMYCFVGEESIEEVKSHKPQAIAEVDADLTTQEVETVVEPVRKIDPNARPTKPGEMLNGFVMLPSGRLHKVHGVVTNSIASRPKGEYEIFERSCNNEIACYLTITPGDTLVGDIEYNGTFKQDFLESLKEPIIVTKDDTPEQAQLKRDVIEARLNLKDAMDRGEDIEKIMHDTREELRDLMRIKVDCEQLFHEEKMKCETMEEVEDLFNAYNKVLESKGVAPVEATPLVKRNLFRAFRPNN